MRILLFLSYSCTVELKRQIPSHTPIVPSKTIPKFKPKSDGQSLYLFSDRNCAKTIPFGAAHTYMTNYKGVPPPPGALKAVSKFQSATDGKK